jgi:hypothetical protein
MSIKVLNLKADIVDVETAFICGDLKEEIFMEIPEVMENDTDNCVSLNTTIYGLV